MDNLSKEELILKQTTQVSLGQWLDLIPGKKFSTYRMLRLCVGYAQGTNLENGNDCIEFLISSKHSGWFYAKGFNGNIVLGFIDNRIQIGTNIDNDTILSKGFSIYGII